MNIAFAATACTRQFFIPGITLLAVSTAQTIQSARTGAAIHRRALLTRDYRAPWVAARFLQPVSQSRRPAPLGSTAPGSENGRRKKLTSRRTIYASDVCVHENFHDKPAFSHPPPSAASGSNIARQSSQRLALRQICCTSSSSRSSSLRPASVRRYTRLP